MRASAVRQDSDVVKAKVWCLISTGQPSTHTSTPSREAPRYICPLYNKSVIKSSLPHLSPLLIWVPGRSKKTFSITVNVGIKEKGKTKDYQGRRQRLLLQRFVDLSNKVPQSLRHRGEIYRVKPGLAVYISIHQQFKGLRKLRQEFKASQG